MFGKVLGMLALGLVCIVLLGTWIIADDRNKKRNIESVLKIAIESAYMAGQIDAIEGNLIIEEVSGDYRWTDSAWTDGRENEFRYQSQYETYKD